MLVWCSCYRGSVRTGADVYLNLQDVIASHPLIVHVMVGIVSIPTVLILHKGKAMMKLAHRPGYVAVATTAAAAEAHSGASRGYSQPARHRARRRDVASNQA